MRLTGDDAIMVACSDVLLLAKIPACYDMYIIILGALFACKSNHSDLIALPSHVLNFTLLLVCLFSLLLDGTSALFMLSVLRTAEIKQMVLPQQLAPWCYQIVLIDISEQLAKSLHA